jgi:hypothetical protein
MHCLVAFLFGVLAVVVGPTVGWSQAGCGGRYACGPEVIVEIDNRPRPPVYQPPASPVMGLCGDYLPIQYSYEARLTGESCGEGAEQNVRLPNPVDKEVMDQWDLISRSGKAFAQEEMQALLQYDITWEGIVEFPLYENWNYQWKVGDFNEARCGSQVWHTTCERSRTETYEEQETYCAEYEITPSSESGSGSGSGSNIPRAPKESGESKDELRDDLDNYYNRYKGGHLLDMFVRPAYAQTCKRWATRTVTKTRSVEPVRYACTKTRPNWCEWFETRSTWRRCANHTATYKVTYAKDPAWKPGYKDSNPIRNFMDILPNKYDLLPGEVEKVNVFANTGRSRVLRPQIKVENAWNEYSYEVSGQELNCRYQMRPSFEIEIHTNGRIKRTAPNPLSTPVDEEGNDLQALFFDDIVDSKTGKISQGLPYEVRLQDHARATMLYAARHSRTLERPDDAEAIDENATYKTRVLGSAGTATSSGYWQETQFRVEMIRLDKWKRPVRMVVPTTFSSNVADILEDSLILHLDGSGAEGEFYRADGPFRFLFGSLYNIFGVELTPGREYYIQVQVAQRGVPFYESGCPGGKTTCEGVQASRKAFSEPLLIKWVADKENDQRSWFRKFKDWQERWMLF